MDTEAAYAVVIPSSFETLTLSYPLSFKAQQWSIGGEWVGVLDMVPECRLAWALEVRQHSQSPGLGFCFDATFHSILQLEKTTQGILMVTNGAFI